jgi:hypothetical protein
MEYACRNKEQLYIFGGKARERERAIERPRKRWRKVLKRNLEKGMG